MADVKSCAGCGNIQCTCLAHLPEMNYKRDQNVFVICRNGKFYTKRGGWTEDITNAAMWPKKQAMSKARIDIGMPCVLFEVVPMVLRNSEIVRT